MARGNVTRKDHPLARLQHSANLPGRKGSSQHGWYVYEHRKVLYDAIGPGVHLCYWCGCSVEWNTGGKCVRGSLVPDHLDGNKSNNRIENLVASCNRCNEKRGMFQSWVIKHSNDPWLWALYQKYMSVKAV